MLVVLMLLLVVLLNTGGSGDEVDYTYDGLNRLISKVTDFADQSDEAGRRLDQAGAGPVPRDGILRPVRLRPRRLDPTAAGPRRAPDGTAQAAPVLAAAL